VSDVISDPGNYYCRKGFYALNVQAICDKLRRFIWVKTGNKGSTHDSTAFAGTRLNQELLSKLAEKLRAKGFFLVGDKAYPLLVYLLVPFDNAESMSPEDAFNYWLSNSRIQIECAFGKFQHICSCLYCVPTTLFLSVIGELIMRWGIFWRTLQFDILKVGHIIKAAMLLHNFIVNERESKGFRKEDALFFTEFSLRDQDQRQNETHEMPSVVATDNNEPHPGGRPSVAEAELQEQGEIIRNGLTNTLYGRGLRRPVTDEMRFNQYGQVYFT
jgi:hypothetical protein